MDNLTYRLDNAEEQMFRLYAHALATINAEMQQRVNFNISLGNDISSLAICNVASEQYFNHGQVPSAYLVHNVCLAMIKLIHVYAPKYSADLNAIVALKEGQRYTAKGKTKPVEIDPSVGIDFYADTTTKS